MGAPLQRIVRFFAVLAPVALGAAPARAQWSTHSLASQRSNLSAVTVGGKSIFAGGGIGGGVGVDAVDLYDSSVGEPSDPAAWSTATLSVARHHLAGTAVGHYALFAGGGIGQTGESAVVDVYDATTGNWSTATLSAARAFPAATTVGTKAIFAGGSTGGNLPGFASDVVDIYDASKGAPSDPLAWSTATLTVPRVGLAAATAGSLALFAGGTVDWAGGVMYDTVDIYDDSTGVWSTAKLTQARAALSATALGSRAYFGGGYPSSTTDSAAVDVYDAITGLWSTTTLSVARGQLAATSVGNTVLFAGGGSVAAGIYDTIDMLDVATGTWTQASLSQGRNMLCATSVGHHALIAGGWGGAGVGGSPLVDVYTDSTGVTYCTAKPNSCGTLPAISGSGTPSATSGGGFTIAARYTKALKPGLLVYTDSGPAALPFSGGLLCVNPMPLKRSIAVVDTTGTPGQCNGTLSIDMNAFAIGALGGTPLPSLTTPGTLVNCQFWGRDTVANGALLTDALEYSVGS